MSVYCNSREVFYVMNIGDGIKRFLSDFFLIQAETCLAIGIIGGIFAPDKQITFSYFFLPVILAAICMLPCSIIYFKENLTVRQIRILRVIEWIVLEIAIEGIIYFLLKDSVSVAVYIVSFFSILICDMLTWIIGDATERKKVNQLNKKLKGLYIDSDDEADENE